MFCVQDSKFVFVSQPKGHSCFTSVLPASFRILAATEFFRHNPAMKKIFAKNLRPHSSILVDGPERAAARAMLYPVGFKEEDFK